jgi:hypothetical protein
VALEPNSSISTALHRTGERDDQNFAQFMTFSDLVFNFAMHHNVEKPRMNAIEAMASLWSSATVRLFLDFKIHQNVIHCFHIQGARAEAASFITMSLAASKAKSVDPM